MIDIKQAVILAGGRGTRLHPITETIPKPMVQIGNKPFLEYLINYLKKNGITEVVLLLGYLAEKIKAYFGDGKGFGIKINYSIQDVSLNNGTRVKRAYDLFDKRFLLLYCDNFWPNKLSTLKCFYEKKGLDALVTIYSNKNNITKNNIKLDQDGHVIKYDPKRVEHNLTGVEIGYFILTKNLVAKMPQKDFHLTKDFLPELIQNKQICGYETNQKYYSIGDLARLPVTRKFLMDKKVIFLDRDGVINKRPPKSDYVKTWAEFEFLPGSIEAIANLSSAGYKIIIISNQAGIARGKMTAKDLEVIHGNMAGEIEKNGGKIEEIYYCPHGWNDNCECRKPEPGLLLKASEAHLVDLTGTLFIGDSSTDMAAADAANSNGILVNDQITLKSVVDDIVQENEDYAVIKNRIIQDYISSKKKIRITSIGGCSRSGKTTLAQKLRQDIQKYGINTRILSLDNWIKSLEKRTGSETVFERFDSSAIVEAIDLIQSGEKVGTPYYDSKTRKTIPGEIGETVHLEQGILIVEGVIGLGIKRIRSRASINIYVEVADMIRMERLFEFYKTHKNCSSIETKGIINSREGEEVILIKDTKQFADYIYHSK